MENLKKRVLIYLGAFLLPIVLFVFMLKYSSIAPFGENSLLHANMELKLLPFFSYFKSIFTENNNIFYSFSSLGGCFNFFAYYLFSPFNFLLLFFPENDINIGITLIAALKLGFCGLTCAYFLNNEFKEHYMSVIFATSFALCGYNLSNLSNLNFYDAIILFPLIMLGVSRIVKENKGTLFFVSLFFAVISNCYISYVILLFSGLYFLYRLILAEKMGLQDVLSRFSNFFLKIVYVLIFTAWVWIPVLSPFGKFEDGFISFCGNFFVPVSNFVQTISKLFVSGSVNVISEEFTLSPNFYVGFLSLLFVILYFLNGNFSKKEKIVTGSFLILLYISYSLHGFLDIWHLGVNLDGLWAEPVHIESFAFVFVLVSIAYKSFFEINSLTKKKLIIAGVIYILLASIVLFNNLPFVEDGYVKFDIACFLISLYVLYVFLENKEHINSIIPVMIGIFVINTCCNICLTNKDLAEDSRLYRNAELNKYYATMKNALKYVKNEDKSFYRIESDEHPIEEYSFYYVFRNTPLLFSYNGFTVFNIWNDFKTTEFYKKIGMPWIMSNRNQLIYDRNVDSFPFSFLGVKYVLSSASNMPKTYSKIHSVPFENSDKTLNVYKNNTAFPIAFVLDKNMAMLQSVKGENNFDVQNNILKILAGKDMGNVYDVEKVLDINELVNNEEFVPIDYEKTLKINKNKDMFLSINDSQGVNNYFEKIYKNSEELNYHIADKDAYFWLNEDKSDRYVTLRFVKENPEMRDFSNDEFSVLVATENADLLKKYVKEIAKKTCKIEKISSSHLHIDLNVDKRKQILFLTIPYDKGWQIKVNRRIREPLKVFDSLMAIPLRIGDEDVDMKYVPVDYRIGLAISLVTLFFLLISIIYLKVSKNDE